MSALSALARRSLALLGMLTASSCTGDLPGELVGTYGVQMKVTTNTCGKLALPIADGAQYAAELRAEAPRGYWRRPKVPPIEGRYEDGAFEFTFQALFDLGQADAGTAGCRLYRDELLTGEVTLAEQEGDAGDSGVAADAATSDAAILEAKPNDAGAASDEDEPLLRGKYIYSFRTDPSGRCANQPGPLGVYERLPCAIEYTLEGGSHKKF